MTSDDSEYIDSDYYDYDSRLPSWFRRAFFAILRHLFAILKRSGVFEGYQEVDNRICAEFQVAGVHCLGEIIGKEMGKDGFSR